MPGSYLLSIVQDGFWQGLRCLLVQELPAELALLFKGNFCTSEELFELLHIAKRIACVNCLCGSEQALRNLWLGSLGCLEISLVSLSAYV